MEKGGMKIIKKLALIPGYIIILLGFLILPKIRELITGEYLYSHPSMNIVGLAIIFIGIYFIVKEFNEKKEGG